MSYTIEYDSFCLKTDNGRTIVWLAGDNNVTDGGRYNRRSRDWSCFLNLLDQSVDVFEAEAAKMAERDPDYEAWKKSSGGWVYRKDVPNWVKQRLKKAMTVEELLAWNQKKIGAVRCCLSIWRGNDWGKMEHTAYVTTTQQFMLWLEKAKQVCEEERKAGHTVYPIITVSTEKVRQKKTLDGDVVFKGRYGYLARLSKDECGWNRDRSEALVFPYEKAVSMISAPDTAYWLRDAQMVSANPVGNSEKPVVIFFEDGRYQGCYISRCTSTSIRTTRYEQSAHRYASEKSALKALDRIKARLGNCGNLAIKYLSEK